MAWTHPGPVPREPSAPNPPGGPPAAKAATAVVAPPTASAPEAAALDRRAPRGYPHYRPTVCQLSVRRRRTGAGPPGPPAREPRGTHAAHIQTRPTACDLTIKLPSRKSVAVVTISVLAFMFMFVTPVGNDIAESEAEIVEETATLKKAVAK